jgi:drug/metabolite transporter (DMT)-like permease
MGTGNWYLYTIIALIAFGIQRFLYKVSAERKCNTAWTTFAFMGTVAVLSSVFFILMKETVRDVIFLFLISLINSGSFLVGTITTIEALKHISTSIAYPIIRLNTAIVVIFSIIYFKDRLSLCQVTGIVVAIGVIVLLTRYNNGEEGETINRNVKRGFFLTFTALCSGAIAAISSKFAATGTNLLGFIALSYTMSTVFSFALRKKMQGKEENPNHRDALMIGFPMGLVNFVGFFSLLKALSVGPLSIIISIAGLYFVIAIMLASIIYHEKLTPLRISCTVMTIIAIALMRM